MKSIPLLMAASCLMTTTIVIPKPKTFTGEIMDSQCAAVGTHGIVNRLNANTKRDCTIECVRSGGQYVLYIPAVETAYGLDDQRKPEAFAGDKVEVVGTVDRLTNTIHVLYIRSAGTESRTVRH
jgi:hypothetical protein